jgi:multidrug efflux pump subunit AcrB
MKGSSAGAAATLGLLGLAGCSSAGAPAFIVLGAYFPGWMLCGAAGLLAVIGARTALILTGLSESVPFQLGVCVSAGIITASLVWFIWFGR